MKALERDQFDEVAGELEDRVSRAGFVKIGEFRLNFGPGVLGIIIDNYA